MDLCPKFTHLCRGIYKIYPPDKAITLTNPIGFTRARALLPPSAAGQRALDALASLREGRVDGSGDSCIQK